MKVAKKLSICGVLSVPRMTDLHGDVTRDRKTGGVDMMLIGGACNTIIGTKAFAVIGTEGLSFDINNIPKGERPRSGLLGVREYLLI